MCGHERDEMRRWFRLCGGGYVDDGTSLQGFFFSFLFHVGFSFMSGAFVRKRVCRDCLVEEGEDGHEDEEDRGLEAGGSSVEGDGGEARLGDGGEERSSDGGIRAGGRGGRGVGGGVGGRGGGEGDGHDEEDNGKDGLHFVD